MRKPTSSSIPSQPIVTSEVPKIQPHAALQRGQIEVQADLPVSSFQAPPRPFRHPGQEEKPKQPEPNNERWQRKDIKTSIPPPVPKKKNIGAPVPTTLPSSSSSSSSTSKLVEKPLQRGQIELHNDLPVSSFQAPPRPFRHVDTSSSSKELSNTSDVKHEVIRGSAKEHHAEQKLSNEPENGDIKHGNFIVKPPMPLSLIHI